MILNFKSGLQRIYIIGSIIWLAFFLYLGFNNLGDKYITDKTKTTVTLRVTCEENFKKNGWEYRKIEDIGGMRFFKVEGKDFIYRSHSGIEGRNDFWGSPSCRTVIKAPFFSRIDEENQKYLYFAFAPIPLYFVLLFIIDGFNQPTRKKKRK